MRKRNNPIPKEHQIIRGFADDEAPPYVVEDWDRYCDGETYEHLDLRHIDFRYSSLVGTSFINCDLRGCDFHQSFLVGTNFQGSDLRGCSFLSWDPIDDEVGILNVNFENCNLVGASFGVEGNLLSCTWNNTNIENANFRNREFIRFFLDLRKTPNTSVYIHGTPTFKDAILLGADLQGADLEKTNLKSANLENATLATANLRGANLEEAILWGADLQEANLQGTNLQYANLRGANLRGANLKSADLENAILATADLQGADLEEATLLDADLFRADLRGARLQNANLENTNLQGVNLQGAYYDANTLGLTDEQKAVMEFIDEA